MLIVSQQLKKNKINSCKFLPHKYNKKSETIPLQSGGLVQAAQR